MNLVRPIPVKNNYQPMYRNCPSPKAKNTLKLYNIKKVYHNVINNIAMCL